MKEPRDAVPHGLPRGATDPPLRSSPLPPLQVLQAGSIRWWVRADLRLSGREAVLVAPDAELLRAQVFLKRSRVVTIARVSAFQAGQPDLLLRRLNYGKWSHRLRDVVRPTRARRFLWNSLLLEQAGLPVQCALAAGEHRHLGWPKAAYLITEEITPAATLTSYLWEGNALRGSTIRRLAEILAQLHGLGFIHGDLKATNILLAEQLQPWLIDLDGVRRFRKTTEAQVAAELARLAAEVRNYPALFKHGGLRFLINYCHARGGADSDPAAVRRLLTNIQQHRNFLPQGGTAK